MKVRGVLVSEFIASVKSDFLRVSKLAEGSGGRVCYVDTVTGFARVQFRGSPCSEDHVSSVVRFLEGVGDALSSCRYAVTYVKSSQEVGALPTVLRTLKSYATDCIVLGNVTKCVKRLEEVALLINVVKSGRGFRLRVRPVCGELSSPLTLDSTPTCDCVSDLIRRVLGVLCEFSEYLGGCLDEKA